MAECLLVCLYIYETNNKMDEYCVEMRKLWSLVNPWTYVSGSDLHWILWTFSRIMYVKKKFVMVTDEIVHCTLALIPRWPTAMIWEFTLTFSVFRISTRRKDKTRLIGLNASPHLIEFRMVHKFIAWFHSNCHYSLNFIRDKTIA